MENKKIGWYENNELLDQLKELKKHQEKQRKDTTSRPYAYAYAAYHTTTDARTYARAICG